MGRNGGRWPDFPFPSSLNTPPVPPTFAPAGVRCGPAGTASPGMAADGRRRVRSGASCDRSGGQHDRR